MNSIQMRTSNTSDGNGSSEQVDAEEDRAIVGWSFDTAGVNTGNDYQLQLTGHVGVSPTFSAGTVVDEGSKWFDTAELVVDSTNGYAVESNLGTINFLDTEHWYDWNEDVTLTFTANNSTANGVAGDLIIYYVEV